MVTPPTHHVVRPTARNAVARLSALIETLGGRPALYELVGGVEHFERLVVTRKSISAYLGSNQRLPGAEMLPRLLCFLNAVEPAVAAGTAVKPRSLRALLKADIARRAAHSAAHPIATR